VTISRRIQISQVARRSALRTLRQPAQVIPSVIFPLMLLAINASGLRSVTQLPGFPTDSFVTFALAIPFMQGALFGVINSGTDLARDIETGFLNRLALTPLRGWALLLGQLGGAVALGAIQATVYLGVGIAAGVRFESGVSGAVLLYVLAILIALGFGTLGILIALKTGSGEAVQSAFPLLFFLLFLSSMNLPQPDRRRLVP
jgi:ABC-2 type transport system permease protein